MSDKEAWCDPVHAAQVILPDGYQMTAVLAAQRGYKIIPWPENVDKVATPHPHDAKRVMLPRGASAERGRALEAGFRIVEGQQTSSSAREAFESWRLAIECLPEARERACAVSVLLGSQTPETLTLNQARAFLRGLPTERSDNTEETMATNDDPRAARRAEIALSAAAFNKSKGYAVKAASSPPPETVDPTKLKRLAELRLSALIVRMAQGDSVVSKEHKNLQYALSVHNHTGAPLATVFNQLGVDTTAMLRNVQ